MASSGGCLVGSFVPLSPPWTIRGDFPFYSGGKLNRGGSMAKKPEFKMFSARIDPDLIKAVKYLSLDLDKPVRNLAEEALRDLLKKYKKKVKG